MKTEKPAQQTTLRQRAEEKLNKMQFYLKKKLSDAEVEKLYQENKILQIELELQNEEFLLENDALKELNRFALELSVLPPEENLETFITRRIKEFAGARASTFSEYNAATRTTTTKHIEIAPGLLEKVIELLGTKIQNIHSVVSEEMYKEITTEMVGVRKTLHEASFGVISRPVGAAIEALLKIDRIIGVVYLIEGKLFGTTLLPMEKGKPDPPKKLLETFAHLAATSLRRNLTERVIKESEEKYRLLFNHMNSGFQLCEIIVDENSHPIDFRYLDGNDKMKEFTGFTIEEARDKTYKHLLPEANLFLIQQFGNVALTGNPMKLEYFSLTFNKYFKINAYSPKKGQFAVIFDDITERKQGEENLKSINERFNLATNAATISIWEHDFLTDIIKIDDNFNTMYGNKHGSRQIGFTDFVHFIHPGDIHIVNTNIDKAIKSGEKNSYEFRIIKPGGEVRNIKAFEKTVKDINNKPLKLIGANIDLTDIKRAELALIEGENKLRQLNADKDKFFSIIAHDLKSPFTLFLGYTKKLAEEMDSMTIDKIHETAAILNKSATNLYNLLDNLLNWTRMKQGLIPFSPQNIALADICNNAVEVLLPDAEKKNIPLHNQIKTDLTLFADADMLKTVLRNLVANAIKFSNSGNGIYIYAEETTSAVTIVVSDNGTGISREDLTRLFDLTEIFTNNGTAGEKGTGLGLLLCREFVEKHNGRIWAESEPGKGSEFKFTLPKEEEANLPAP